MITNGVQYPGVYLSIPYFNINARNRDYSIVGDVMNQKDYEKNINWVWDWIEEQQALTALMPGYINDPVDVDKEDCFV